VFSGRIQVHTEDQPERCQIWIRGEEPRWHTESFPYKPFIRKEVQFNGRTVTVELLIDEKFAVNSSVLRIYEEDGSTLVESRPEPGQATYHLVRRVESGPIQQLEFACQ